MFDLLRRIIKPDPPEERLPAYRVVVTPPPNRGPSYDSRLIENLKHDHKELVHLFQQIGMMVDQRRFNEIPNMLISFKTRLESHLLAENVRFYNYVEYSLRGDDENIALIRSFRREMNAIARGVVDFVKKYQRVNFDEPTRNAFLADYRAVGGLLTQRIEREENSLYPLYEPS